MAICPTGRRKWLAGIGALVILGFATSAQAQFGSALSGTGPINRSMGGAATAAPIDAARGPLFWNPAAIAGLDHSEIGFGAEVLIPSTTITSRVAANSIGPGLPAKTMSGMTGGNNGAFALPSFGLVYKPEDSLFTYGLGIYAIGGFGLNYPVSKTNPILNPQFPNGFGVGPLFSQYQVLQIAPTIAFEVTDEWFVGFQPNLDLDSLSLDPAIFVDPSLISSPIGQGPVYSDATHSRSRAGGGFQVGAYYTPTASNWTYGFSFKSPQWFATSTYPAVNPQGQAIQSKADFDFPMIASIGTAYRGIDRLLVALDVRYIGFRETSGYRNTGFDSAGALRGLGFQDIVALSLGAQYQLTDELTVRVRLFLQHEPDRQRRDELQHRFPSQSAKLPGIRPVLRCHKIT